MKTKPEQQKKKGAPPKPEETKREKISLTIDKPVLRDLAIEAARDKVSKSQMFSDLAREFVAARKRMRKEG